MLFRILFFGALVVLMEFSPLAAQPYDRPSSTRSARSMVLAKRGAVCASQPLASEAGLAVLRRGGNAFDAAIASFFALTVVEPMMVGIVGGGITHIRFADGRHTVIDGQVRAPLASGPDCFRPI